MLDKAVLNTEEAAKLLGLSPYTIREFAREGRIPGRKIGKEWRFSREGLLRWLETPALTVYNNKEANTELYRLIDALPEEKLQAARRVLEQLSTEDDEEELSPEDLEAVRRGLEDLKAGRFKSLESLRQELKL